MCRATWLAQRARFALARHRWRQRSDLHAAKDIERLGGLKPANFLAGTPPTHRHARVLQSCNLKKIPSVGFQGLLTRFILIFTDIFWRFSLFVQ